MKKQDLEDFDYIIAMDDNNLSYLRRMAERNHQRLYRLTDFIPDTTYREVPDPYYTGNFEEVYELVSAGCRGLLERIKEEQGWK